jgi:hypothetical protein
MDVLVLAMAGGIRGFRLHARYYETVVCRLLSLVALRWWWKVHWGESMNKGKVASPV